VVRVLLSSVEELLEIFKSILFKRIGGEFMADITIGVFSSTTDAEYAIHDLQDAGYDPKNISIMMKDTKQATEVAESTGSSVGAGATSGMATGGLLGGLAGLLVGIGAITIPGLGGFLIGGPLAVAFGLTGAAASTATGAITGAVVGGVIGALTNLGVPEEDARVYESRVNAGGILVVVPSMENTTTEARAILQDNNADQVKVVHAALKEIYGMAHAS
jgi:hypothetical protein